MKTASSNIVNLDIFYEPDVRLSKYYQDLSNLSNCSQNINKILKLLQILQ